MRKKRQNAAGKQRQCRYCKVFVTVDQTAAHLSGKKHRKLAGTTSDTDCWNWVDAPAAHAAVAAHGALDVDAPTDATVEPTIDSGAGGKWQSARGTKKRGAAHRAPARPTADAYMYVALPTLGFKVVNGAEPILPLIRSGHKTIELRRKGSRLSDGTRMDDLPVGSRFVGVPLGSHLVYKCVLEVSGPIVPFASHGAAWEVHRERAVPRALGPVHSAAEAQRFYEKAFYDGCELVDEAVIAIPVRVIAWMAS